jgi:transcriptional regulator with XRE-family HTH domain
VNVIPPPSKQPPDPREFERPVMRGALIVHDVTRVFRQLQKIGFSQQRIATITGQSQPEVSAIIHGRKVQAYEVLRRVFTSLGVPLCLVGMAGCCECCPHQFPDDGAGVTLQPLPPLVPPLKPLAAENTVRVARLWTPNPELGDVSLPPRDLGARLLG